MPLDRVVHSITCFCLPRLTPAKVARSPEETPCLFACPTLRMPFERKSTFYFFCISK